MPRQKLVLLTGNGESGLIAARYLAARFDDLTVIVEQPESRLAFLRRRVRRLGAFTVAGQMIFMIFQRIQQRLAKRRIESILAEGGLGRQPPDAIAIERVSSVNSAECIAMLKRLDPAVVLVAGSPVISVRAL